MANSTIFFRSNRLSDTKSGAEGGNFAAGSGSDARTLLEFSVTASLNAMVAVLTAGYTTFGLAWRASATNVKVLLKTESVNSELTMMVDAQHVVSSSTTSIGKRYNCRIKDVLCACTVYRV